MGDGKKWGELFKEIPALTLPPLTNEVIRFNIGDNGFQPPKAFLESLRKVISEEWKTREIHKMVEEQGIKGLREKIAEKVLPEIHGLKNYDADQILITCGGQAGINVVLSWFSCHHPNGEIIIPTPFYPYHARAAILSTHREPRYVKAEISGERITVDIQALREMFESLNDRPVLLILCSPNNPAGYVLNQKELKEITEVVCAHRKAYVLSDEVYTTFVYNGEFKSIASISDEIRSKTFVLGSFSKIYGLTGWRIGYVVAPSSEITKPPKEMIPGITELHDNLNIQPATVAQRILEVALEYDSPFREIREIWVPDLKKRRDLLYKGLKNLDGIKPNMPEGAFYIFAEVRENFIKEFRKDEKSPLCDRARNYLYEKAKILVAPGLSFGKEYENYLRLAFSWEPLDRIEEAIERLSKL